MAVHVINDDGGEDQGGDEELEFFRSCGLNTARPLQAHQQDGGEDRAVPELGGVQQDLWARQQDSGDARGGDEVGGQGFK